jgi:hypothetical protein
MERNLLAGLFHASASLGIAEAAFARAADPGRINGDASLTGYCYKGRKVFCVMYYDSGLSC